MEVLSVIINDFQFMRPFIVFVLIFLVVFGTIANFYMIRLLTWTAVIG